MTTDPIIWDYIDDEEKELYEAIESNTYIVPKNELTTERKKELQEVARNTINEERTRISLRVPRRNLLSIKSKALQKGIPYQTYLNSIIHEHVHSNK